MKKVSSNKDYEIVVHVTMLVVDGKVVLQGDIYNDTEITLDMMALAGEEEEGEHDDGDEDSSPYLNLSFVSAKNYGRLNSGHFCTQISCNSLPH